MNRTPPGVFPSEVYYLPKKWKTRKEAFDIFSKVHYNDFYGKPKTNGRKRSYEIHGKSLNLVAFGAFQAPKTPLFILFAPIIPRCITDCGHAIYVYFAISLRLPITISTTACILDCNLISKLVQSENTYTQLLKEKSVTSKFRAKIYIGIIIHRFGAYLASFKMGRIW